MNFRYKIMQFMNGRYGLDTFFYVLFAVAAALAFANCFLRLWPLQIVVYAIGVYAFFRVFSRNTNARSAENSAARKLLTKFSRQAEIKRQRKADTSHIYKKCPQCRAVLRLPRRIGTHKTVCPRCGKEFSVRVTK